MTQIDSELIMAFIHELTQSAPLSSIRYEEWAKLGFAQAESKEDFDLGHANYRREPRISLFFGRRFCQITIRERILFSRYVTRNNAQELGRNDQQDIQGCVR